MRKLLSIAAFTVIASALTFAHVTVAPQQAPAGASQVYKVRVHNDEKTAVSSIERRWNSSACASFPNEIFPCGRNMSASSAPLAA